MDAVLVTPSCGDPLYRRAARVSMGTVFQIPWTRITGFNDDGTENKHYWPFQGIDELKSLGFTTVAMALEDRSISLDELTRRLHAPAEDPTHIDKLALIFGTEGDGLSHHTIARADLTVKIPMSHGVDSLNVAASSAVAFYATLPGQRKHRQRCGALCQQPAHPEWCPSGGDHHAGQGHHPEQPPAPVRWQCRGGYRGKAGLRRRQLL